MGGYGFDDQAVPFPVDDDLLVLEFKASGNPQCLAMAIAEQADTVVRGGHDGMFSHG